MKKMINISSLKIFLSIYEGKNFSEVALALNRDKSSVFRELKTLEKNLGEKLFFAQKKSMIPTPFANSLYPCTKEYIQQLQSIEGSFKTDEEITGSLSMGVTHSISATWLMPFLSIFTKRLQNLRLIITIADFYAISHTPCDVFIGPKIEEDNFKNVLLYEETLKLYASEQYIKEYGIPTDENNLKNHKFLSFSNSGFLPFKKINKHLSKKITSHICIGSGIGMICAVESGLGIGPLSRDYGLYSKKKLIQVLPDFNAGYFQIFLSYPYDKETDKRISSMEEELLKIKITNEKFFI